MPGLVGRGGSCILQQAKISENDCQKIVEVMGDTAGELPQYLHFLRMHQLEFPFLAFGNIEERDHGADHDAVSAHWM